MYSVSLQQLYDRVGDGHRVNAEYFPKFKDWLENNLGLQRSCWIFGGPQVKVGGVYMGSEFYFDKEEDATAFKLTFYNSLI